jgi:hypothetical protein
VAEKVKGSPPFVVDYLEIKKPSQLTRGRGICLMGKFLFLESQEGKNKCGFRNKKHI